MAPDIWNCLFLHISWAQSLFKCAFEIEYIHIVDVSSANKYSLEKVKCSMLKRVVDFINRIKYFYLEKSTKSFSLKNIGDAFDTRCRSSLIFKFLNRMNFMACICFVCYVIQIHVYSLDIIIIHSKMLRLMFEWCRKQNGWLLCESMGIRYSEPTFIAYIDFKALNKMKILCRIDFISIPRMNIYFIWYIHQYIIHS